MFGLNGFVRHAVVWLAAFMVPVQPLWTVCSGSPGRRADPVGSCRCCHHAGQSIGHSTGRCPGGCMCPDTTPTPEEPLARLARRRSENERQEDFCVAVASGTVKPGASPRQGHVHGRVHPLAASEHCALLCRLLL